MNFEGLLELVKKRRSIKKFKTTPISRELIEKILEIARWAPSGANSQPWEFIVIEDEILRKRVVEILMSDLQTEEKIEDPESRLKMMFNFKDAPVFILVCGDPRTKIFYPSRTPFDKLVYPERATNTFISSMANVFLYIQLAAPVFGLGSKWVSGVVRKQSELKKLLEIPDIFIIYDMAAIGYPDEEPKARHVRSLNEMTHNNKYELLKFRSEKVIIEQAQKTRYF